MDMNFTLKVYGGKRTPVEVGCYPTNVNEKVMVFANGKSISDKLIAEFVHVELANVLSKLQKGDPLTKVSTYQTFIDNG